MHWLMLASLLVTALPSNAQEVPKTAQPAQVNAAIEVTIDSIRPTKNGLAVSLSYINRFQEPIQFTLTYPQEKSAFAVDDLGNEYVLANATGMIRQHMNPNLDMQSPTDRANHSTFLLAPPNTKVQASFLFKRTTELTDPKEKPSSFNISIGHYARPAEKFDPVHRLARAFGFTATVTNAKPDKQ